MSHVHSPANIAEHKSRMTFRLPIDRPTVQDSLLLWFLPELLRWSIMGGLSRPILRNVRAPTSWLRGGHSRVLAVP